MSRFINISVSLFFLFLALLACKKESQTPEIDPNTGCSNCASSTATTFNGILKTTQSTTNSVSGNTVAIRASAYFSSQPVALPEVAKSVTVTNVIYNKVDTLINFSAPYFYSKAPVSITTESWVVVGANDIPSFNYKNLKTRPAYTSLSGIPDTIKKTTGFTFIVNEITNATGATVFVSDGAIIGPKITTKSLGVGTDTVIFTSDNLNALSTSTTAYVSLIIENAHGVKVEGKDFKFSQELSYTKKVVIKN